MPFRDFYDIVDPRRLPLTSEVADRRPIIFLTTRTSGTGSIWRIITKLTHRHYRLYGFDWLDGLDRNGVYRLTDALVAPAPSIIAAQTIWPLDLDPTRYRFIVNARDPRDLLCNLYSWQFEHGNLEGDTEFLRRKARRALAKGVDDYVMARDIRPFFAPILEMVPKVSPADVHFATYAMLCCHFDAFIEGLARHLHIELTPDIRRSLESERTENIAANPAWIGNSWSGADLKPGRFHRELSPPTVAHLNKAYAPILDFLRRHDHPRVADTYAMSPSASGARCDETTLAATVPQPGAANSRHLAFAAQAARHEGSTEAAARSVSALLQHAPEDPNAWSLQAQLLLARGESEAAVEALRRAIDLEPRRERNYALAIDALIEMRKPASSLGLCRLMDSNGFDGKQILVKRAHIFGHAGRLAAAERCMELAVALDPANDEDWRNLALFQIGRGKHQEALQALTQALLLRPHAADLLVLLGEAAVRCGQLALAKESFRAALWSNPKCRQTQAAYARHLSGNAGDREREAFAAWLSRQQRDTQQALRRFRKKWARGRRGSALTSLSAVPAAIVRDLGRHRLSVLDSLPQPARTLRLLLLMDSLNGGGVQAVMLRLAKGFRDAGLDVSLAVMDDTGELRTEAEAAAPCLDLKSVQVASPFASWVRTRAIARYFRQAGVGWPLYGLTGLLRDLPAITEALRRTKPDIVLSATTRCNFAVLSAAPLAGTGSRLVVSEHTNMSAVLQHKALTAAARRRIARVVGGIYASADAVVAVSRGLQEDLTGFPVLPRDKLHTIYNPAFDSELPARTTQPPEEPWLRDKDLPVCVTIGRISEQKGYDILLEALAIVNRERPLRLLAMGGADKKRHRDLQAALVARCAELGIADKVKFLGHRVDCPALLSHADLYVQASRYEGFGLAIVEALALGVPVVSTDCPSGPGEILEQGRYGTLVPPENPSALAAAMLASLTAPKDSVGAQKRAEEFSSAAAVRSYLTLFEGLVGPESDSGAVFRPDA